ncbi:hypothetical protein NGM99_12625 [Mesorhizobium sp. RP14(2022)]|uniref:Mu P family protein n=1 Tax=Mesorhizobium liriopis TaxID=2953882 RepID=A0ABT1C714_9HYPH|nr:hypothetical protein [Mesorhizobium liriopis]MCO6050628.1 hypothetical protein [Mesorhizobium liriopis]
MLESVVLTVGGRQLPHTRCSLRSSAREAVREASFSIAWNEPGLPCIYDEPATIDVSGERWGTGYVGSIQPSMNPEDRSYEVSFVSRTIDATECSIDHPTGLAVNVDIMGVAKAFDTLGIGIEGDVESETKPRHKINLGETLFDTIEDVARGEGILIYDTPKGKLRLASKPDGRHVGALTQGHNIIEASAQLSGATRHSSVKVRGQSSIGVTGSALRPEAEAIDPGVRRKRPLIIIYEGEANSINLKRRAAWEARRGAGRGTSATITVPGWRDAGGTLWTRNFIVPVESDWLGIAQDMIVSDVALVQDADNGTTTTLNLQDPRALGGENPRGKSSTGWDTPAALEPTYRIDSDD